MIAPPNPLPLIAIPVANPLRFRNHCDGRAMTNGNEHPAPNPTKNPWNIKSATREVEKAAPMSAATEMTEPIMIIFLYPNLSPSLPATNEKAVVVKLAVPATSERTERGVSVYTF